MKYYKLIYSEEKQRKVFYDEIIEADGAYCDNDGVTNIEKIIDEWMEPIGYAWFIEGEIYPENFNNDGESLKVSELVKEMPEDWEEVVGHHVRLSKRQPTSFKISYTKLSHRKK